MKARHIAANTRLCSTAAHYCEAAAKPRLSTAKTVAHAAHDCCTAAHEPLRSPDARLARPSTREVPAASDPDAPRPAPAPPRSRRSLEEERKIEDMRQIWRECEEEYQKNQRGCAVL